jgi:predicted amidohydrolase YtcJ
VIGADERVSPYEAMQMITIWGAEQFGEQASKGSIAVGKRADLVVLSDNPVTMDPTKINEVVVLETIKDGKSVWVRQ